MTECSPSTREALCLRFGTAPHLDTHTCRHSRCDGTHLSPQLSEDQDREIVSLRQAQNGKGPCLPLSIRAKLLWASHGSLLHPGQASLCHVLNTVLSSSFDPKLAASCGLLTLPGESMVGTPPAQAKSGSKWKAWLPKARFRGSAEEPRVCLS